MSDERNSGPPGNGNGGGRGADDGFDEHEEPTVVIVSRDFLIGSLGRASSALYGAGDVALEARKLVTEGAGSPALHDLIEKLYDLSDVTAGMARALERLNFEEETQR